MLISLNDSIIYFAAFFCPGFPVSLPSNESDENTDMCLNKSFLFIVLAYLKLSWLKHIKGNIKKTKILNYDMFIFFTLLSCLPPSNFVIRKTSTISLTWFQFRCLAGIVKILALLCNLDCSAI